MAAHLLAVLLSLLTLVPVYGLGPFINPPEQADGSVPVASTDSAYAVGNSWNITWEPLNGTATLTIWQSLPNGTDIGGLQYLPGSRFMDRSYYVWDPIGVDGKNNQPILNLAASNIFHFDLYENEDTYATGLSMWFNLSSDTVNAQGSVISTPTASSSTSLTSLPTSTTPTSSPTLSSPQSSPTHTTTGLSTGAKAGIGIGVSLGVLALIGCIAGIFLWTRRKRNVPIGTPQTAYPYSDISPMGQLKQDYPAEMPAAISSRVEMDGSPQPSGPVELPPNRYD